jgi:hypothetical protein
MWVYPIVVAVVAVLRGDAKWSSTWAATGPALLVAVGGELVYWSIGSLRTVLYRMLLGRNKRSNEGCLASLGALGVIGFGVYLSVSNLLIVFQLLK